MKIHYPVLCFAAITIAASSLSTTYGQSPATKPAGSAAPLMHDDHMMHPMAEGAMQMDKAREMASPAMVKKAGESMMAHDDMPMMMAHEMSMAATMAKPKAMTMVAEHASMMTPAGAPMVTDNEIKNAIRKVFSDPAQFQALLQTMIARETASAMMASAPTMAAPMMAAEPAMLMQAKEAMMTDKPAMTESLAKEMMIQAMAKDEKIMAAVKSQAMATTMPAVKGMMKDDKMMMAEKSMGTPLVCPFTNQRPSGDSAISPSGFGKISGLPHCPTTFFCSTS